MRPVKLTVAGMRSYRAQRTLDFSDRTLMAILGDTGSGKSSLLEALYGALYGGSTWDARGLGVLIADGVKTLQIELQFQARGKTYTVSRSCSRDGYPPSKHVFDGPDGEHLDGEKDVNRRIVQLVGLTGPEFLRVVILPQGRFGQLLQGSAGERIPILRGILGLGVLDRVKEVADRHGSDLAAALEPIVAARARLYPDPKAVAATAEAASTKHRKVVKKLDAAVSAIRDLDTATASVSRALPTIREALDLATSTDLQPVVAELNEADAADKKMAAEEKDLTAALAEKEKQASSLQGELAAATAAGFTPAALATMSVALTRVAATLPDLAREAQEQSDEQAGLVAADSQLALDAQAVRANEELAVAHRLALTDLVTAAENAREQARLQAERIAAIDRAIADLALRDEQLADAVDEVLLEAQVLHGGCSDAADSAAEQQTIAAQLAALRDANAAAHVARQHAAGQPCPVCDQPLPNGFTPPEILGEQGLVDAFALAEVRAQKATAAERAQQRAVDISRERLLSAATAAAAVAGSVGELLGSVPTSPAAASAEVAGTVDAAVQRILDLPADKPPTTKDAGQDAADLTGALRALTGLDAAARFAASPEAGPTLKEAEAVQSSTAKALQAAERQLEELSTTAARVSAEHRAAADALARGRQLHAAAADRTAHSAQRLANEIRELPTLLSEPLVTSLHLSAPDPVAALLTAGQLPPELLTELQGRLDGKQAELAQLSERRESVRDELAQLRPGLITGRSWRGGGS